MKPANIKRHVKDRIQRRKKWRAVLIAAATKMFTSHDCNSDQHKPEVAKAAAKVVAWHGRFGHAVLNAIQRRVIRGGLQ